MGELEMEIIASHDAFMKSAQARIMPSETRCITCDVSMRCTHYEEDGRTMIHEVCPKCRATIRYFRPPPHTSVMDLAAKASRKGGK